MKNRITEYIQNAINFLKDGLEKARSNGTPQKIIIFLAKLSVGIAGAFILLKMLGYLYDSIYSLIDRHFPALTASAAGVGYLVYRSDEKKKEKKKKANIEQTALDNQRSRFAKGCYNPVAQFLYVNVCTSPNFSDLTSCTRPYRPDEMGNSMLDAYVMNGLMYLRYALPKMTRETLDCCMISSVLQGLINQRIKTGGLQPFITAGENSYLYLDKVEDMQTYISLQLVLNFDESYIQQIAFQNAMNNVIERENASRQLEDNDYHA